MRTAVDDVERRHGRHELLGRVHAREVRKVAAQSDGAERDLMLGRLARVQLRAQRYKRVEPLRIYQEFY